MRGLSTPSTRPKFGYHHHLVVVVVVEVVGVVWVVVVVPQFWSPTETPMHKLSQSTTRAPFLPWA